MRKHSPVPREPLLAETLEPSVHQTEPNFRACIPYNLHYIGVDGRGRPLYFAVLGYIFYLNWRKIMNYRKRSIANRENAKKSTGPKTAEGKAASKMNAIKHGLLAQDVVLRGESPDEFDALRDDLVDEIRPVGCLEIQLAERAAACFWRLRRAQRIEAGIYAHHQAHVEVEAAGEEIKATFDSNRRSPPNGRENKERYKAANQRLEECETQMRAELPTLGAAFIRDAETMDATSKLLRHENALQGSLYKALHELQRLQAARQTGPLPAPGVIDVTVNGDLPFSDGA